MNITNFIYIILAIIIISLSVAVGVKNYNINLLKSEKDALTAQITAAESHIDLQNSKILEMQVDRDKAKEKYKNDIMNLEEKYKNLEKLSTDNKTCNEIVNIINKNQRSFLYEKN